MITREQLMDETNFDWGVLPNGEFAWFENEHDLEVRVYNKKYKSGSYHVFVRNRDSDWEIDLGTDWKPYLMTAIRYCQFGPYEDWTRGSVEHFWAMAKAIKEFGTEPDFAATQEGIHAHVGPENYFMEYVDGRYVIFDEGCLAYAGTPKGVVKAYLKVKEEIELWSRA